MGRRISFAAAILILVSLQLAPAGEAQEAESTAIAPPGAPTAAPDLPPGAPSSGPAGKVADPEECTVTPLSKTVVVDLIRKPTAEELSAATPTPVDPTVGEPADKETRSAIRATVREFAACHNAGDIPRMLALFTPDRLEKIWIGIELDGDAAYQQLSTPVPSPPSQQWGIVKVEQIRMLGDERVRAMVTIDFPGGAGIEPPSVFTFVADGDRWLIDEIAPAKIDEENSD